MLPSITWEACECFTSAITYVGAANEPRGQFPPLRFNAPQSAVVYLRIKNQYLRDSRCVAPHLYDFASRLAGVCLLGEEEEEEGRRWVVENAGASEIDPRRWSLLGEPDPEPPPLDRGELTRWLGKVELE